MKQIAFLAVLALSVAACSNRDWSPLSATVVPTAATGAAGAGAPVPTTESYVSDSCGFPLLVQLDGKVKEIPLPGDRVKVLFPGFSTTVTNTATGRTIGFSSTGSFHISLLPDGHTGFVYTGRNGYDDPVEGRFLFLIGRFSEEYDEAFNVVTPLHGSGQILDICKLIG